MSAYVLRGKNIVSVLHGTKNQVRRLFVGGRFIYSKYLKNVTNIRNTLYIWTFIKDTYWPVQMKN